MIRLVFVFGVAWLLVYMCYTLVRRSTIKSRKAFLEAAWLAVFTFAAAFTLLILIVDLFD